MYSTCREHLQQGSHCAAAYRRTPLYDDNVELMTAGREGGGGGQKLDKTEAKAMDEQEVLDNSRNSSNDMVHALVICTTTPPRPTGR